MGISSLLLATRMALKIMEKRNATLDDLKLEKFLREREQELIVYNHITLKNITTLPINKISDKLLDEIIKEKTYLRIRDDAM